MRHPNVSHRSNARSWPPDETCVVIVQVAIGVLDAGNGILCFNQRLALLELLLGEQRRSPRRKTPEQPVDERAQVDEEGRHSKAFLDGGQETDFLDRRRVTAAEQVAALAQLPDEPEFARFEVLDAAPGEVG